MRYTPHTPSDIAAMLAAVGVPSSVDELVRHVPAALRATAAIDLPPGLPEHARCAAARRRWRRAIAAAGPAAFSAPVPIRTSPGGGRPDPAARRVLLRLHAVPARGEPGHAAGDLRVPDARSRCCSGIEVANASMYDGASATAEAVLMALRLQPKRRASSWSRALHPHYRETVRDLPARAPATSSCVEAPFGADGRIDSRAARRSTATERACASSSAIRTSSASSRTCARVPRSRQRQARCWSRPPPSRWRWRCCSRRATAAPTSPSAKGRASASRCRYGGPGVGLFATRERTCAACPGGSSARRVDDAGRRGYVLTLATREQHIRRERATSNICTNHGLIALAVTVYLSLLGKHGLRAAGATSICARAHRARRARSPPAGAGGCAFAAPFFNEFVGRGAGRARRRWRRRREAGVLAGVPLGELVSGARRRAADLPSPRCTTTAIDRLVGGSRRSWRIERRAARQAGRPAARRAAIFERSSPGRLGVRRCRTRAARRPTACRRSCVREPIEGFPEVSEPEVLRHFLRLSQWNFGTATTFYPLGSCTMKYNPLANEVVARLPGFAGLHPLAPDATRRARCELMWELQEMLAEISGMDAVSLAAGGRRARRAHRHEDDPRLPPRPRRRAPTRAHPGERARHQSGERRAVRATACSRRGQPAPGWSRRTRSAARWPTRSRR